MTDDIETEHLWPEYGDKRVLFVQPTKFINVKKRSPKEMFRYSIYHELSATSHYLWSKLGLDLSEGRQLGPFFFQYETWYEFVLRTRAAGINTQLIKLMERLNKKFGTRNIETWLEEGRMRGGVIILFKNSIEETPMFDKSPFDEVGAKPIILDKPLSTKHIYAILPTNASAAQRLEELKF